MINRNNLIGKEIGGSYKIIDVIGDGSFGSVYLAEHIIFTERPRVAIKLLHTHLSLQEQNRFVQEARLLESLKDKSHILPIVQAGIQDNIPFLVTEYADNGSITDHLLESETINAAGDHRDQGDTFFRGKDYEQALQSYNVSLVLDENADTYNRIGNVLRQLKRNSEALDAYEKAIRVVPQNKREIFYCNIAQVLLDLKMHEHAFRAYNEAIRLSPTKAIFYVYKGDALRDFKDFKGALHVYEEAIKYSTNVITSAKAHAGKGEAFMRLRYFPEAIKEFEEAIKLQPTNALFYLALGHVHWKCKQNEEACKAYTQGLKVDPNNKDLLEKKNLVCK